MPKWEHLASNRPNRAKRLFDVPAAAFTLGIREKEYRDRGMPMGGIGTGSFQHTRSGGFKYWILDPVLVERPEASEPNQFHVYMESGSKKVATVMNTGRHERYDWGWEWPGDGEQ